MKNQAKLQTNASPLKYMCFFLPWIFAPCPATCKSPPLRMVSFLLCVRFLMSERSPEIYAIEGKYFNEKDSLPTESREFKQTKLVCVDCFDRKISRYRHKVPIFFCLLFLPREHPLFRSIRGGYSTHYWLAGSGCSTVCHICRYKRFNSWSVTWCLIARSDF